MDGMWICGWYVTHKLLNVITLCFFSKFIYIFEYTMIRLPYDWKNPAGYLFTVAITLLVGMYPFQYMGCIVFLALGSFIFAISIVKVFKVELHSINKMANDKQPRRNMYKKLSEFIQMQSISKQLSGSPTWPQNK